MATIASLNIDLKANVTKFTAGMRKGVKSVESFGSKVANTGKRIAKFSASATKSFGKFSVSLAGMTKRMTKYSAVTIGAAGAATAFFVQQQMKAIDVIDKTAGKLGLSTEALSQFRFAAKVAGISVGTFDMSFQRFARRLGEASKGTGEARDALKRLGIDAVALGGKPHEAFLKVADAMTTVETATEKLGLAQKLFDSEGVSLVNMFSRGSQGLREFAKQADNLNLTLSRIQVSNVVAANDALGVMQARFTGIARQVAVQVSPFIAEAANLMSEFGARGKDVGRTFAVSMDAVAGFVAGIGTSFQFLAVSFDMIEAKMLQFAAKAVRKKALVVGTINDIGESLGLLDPKISKFQEKILKNTAKMFDKQADALLVNAGTDFFKLLSGDNFGNKFLKRFDEIASRLDKSQSSLIRAQAIFAPLGDIGSAASRLKIGTAGALERGTAAAFSAANRNSRNSVDEKQLAELKKHGRRLEEIARNVKPMRAAVLGP